MRREHQHRERAGEDQAGRGHGRPGVLDARRAASRGSLPSRASSRSRAIIRML